MGKNLWIFILLLFLILVSTNHLNAQQLNLNYFTCGLNSTDSLLNNLNKKTNLLGVKSGFVGPSFVKIGVVSLKFNDRIIGSNDGDPGIGLTQQRANDWVNKHTYSLKPFYEYLSNGKIFVSSNVVFKKIRIFEDLTFTDTGRPIGYPTEDCKLRDWTRHIEQSLIGTDITHLHIVIPRITNCAWLGLASGFSSVLGAYTTFQKGDTVSPYILNHEIGHVFGIFHSSATNFNNTLQNYTYNEYGGFDVMAFPYSNTLNASQRMRTGWLFPGEVDSTTYPNEKTPVISASDTETEKTVYITNINSSDDHCTFATCSKAYRLKSFEYSNYAYFLSYRGVPSSFDEQTTPISYPRVYIHKDRYPIIATNSYRLASLGLNEIFDFKMSNQYINDFSNRKYLYYEDLYEVTVLETTSHWAKVKVKTKAVCNRNDPTVNLINQDHLLATHSPGSISHFEFSITNNDERFCPIREFNAEVSFLPSFYSFNGPSSTAIEPGQTKTIKFIFYTPLDISTFNTDPEFEIKLFQGGSLVYSENGEWNINTNSNCVKINPKIELSREQNFNNLEPLDFARINIKITNLDQGFPSNLACNNRNINWQINTSSAAFLITTDPIIQNNTKSISPGESFEFTAYIQAPVDTYNYQNQIANFKFFDNNTEINSLFKTITLAILNFDMELYINNKISGTNYQNEVKETIIEGEKAIVQFKLTAAATEDQTICLKTKAIDNPYVSGGQINNNVSATAGADYSPIDECKTIVAGESSTKFTINTYNDLNGEEVNEVIQFELDLSATNILYVNQNAVSHKLIIENKETGNEFKLRTYLPGQDGNPFDEFMISWNVKNWNSYIIEYSDDFFVNPNNPTWLVLYNYPQFRRVQLSSDPIVSSQQVIENFIGVTDSNSSPGRIYRVIDTHSIDD